MTSLGIIGGTGWLGGTLARGMLAAGVIEARDLTISNRSGRFDGFGDWPDIHFTTDNAALAARSEVVLLSVQPQRFGDLAIAAQDKLVISVMAVIGIDRIRAATGAGRVVRSMPTFTAEHGLSYTPWYATPEVTAADRATTQRLLAPSGLAEEVEREELIDFFTALTGSGPGFLTYVADSLVESAIAHGVDRGRAECAVRMMIHGAGVHIGKAEASPRELVRSLLEYRGIATAGIEVLIASTLAADLHGAVSASYAKAKAGLPES